MKIFQGVDLVALGKFREVFSRHASFAQDLFTEEERAYCEGRHDSSIHFAGRFAAKEATLKALGVGITTGIDKTFREVEVSRGSSGKPVLRFHGWVRTLIERLGVRQATVSISHSSDYAIATVILISAQGEPTCATT